MNTGLPPKNWDTKLQQLDGSFLQSRAWALVQTKLGRDVVWAEGEGWAWCAAVRESHGLRYVMCSYGPAAQNEAAFAESLASLREAGQKLYADFVRFEPQQNVRAQELRSLNTKRIGEVDPEHTRVLDLTLKMEDIRSALTSGHRNLINGTERRGISIRQSDKTADFEVFLKMLGETAEHSGVSFHPESYFRAIQEVLGAEDVSKLYVAEVGAEPVAAALFYDWGSTRYYAHAGAHQERNREVKASVSLVWQAIVDAKAAGLKRFDLWGVAPEGDSNHHLASLSKFKNAFGGTQVDYLGTWDMPLKPIKYAAYKFYRQIRGRE